MIYQSIPQEIRELRQWVNCYDKSKVPMRSHPVGLPASSTNPDSWGTFEDAVSAVNSGDYDGIGFVFADNGIVGIDIDAGYQDGTLTEMASDIITVCNSYTEVSRSGRGFHILLRGSLPFSGRNNREGLEIYQSQRFFILTGQDAGFGGCFRENQAAIDRILDKYFGVVSAQYTERSERYYSGIWNRPQNGRIPLRPQYPVIGSGGRNNSLLSVAGAMWTQGYSPREIFTELLQINSEACRPPLPRREIEQIISSVTRYRR